MLNKIVHFAIYNRLIIAIGLIILLLLSVFSISNLKIDAVPDITSNQVVIISECPLLATQEVEQYVTVPIELQMNNIKDLKELRSTSRQGLSVITLVFDEDTDVYWARQQITEQLNTAKENIPAAYANPYLAPITTGLGEIYQYTLDIHPDVKELYSLTYLRTLQDWTIKKQLQGTVGVSEISSFGGFVKQYQVKVISDKLIQYGLSTKEVYDAITLNNANTGGSYIEKNNQNYFIRGDGEIKNFDDIGNIPIKTLAGIPVLVKDVAELSEGTGNRFGAMTKNGESETVGAVVLMLKGANAQETIDILTEKVEKLNTNLPKGIKIKPFINRSKLIKNATNTVTQNLIEGGLIVAFILILLLGSLKAGLIVASIIPITMTITLGIMAQLGLTANLMSLGALDFGLLVDCSIIVVEAVVLALHNKQKGILDFNNLVYTSSTKVLKAAVFGGLIILIVYFPILSLQGIEGKMFRPMAYTVVIALIIAIILSITYIPMMCALFLKNAKEFKFTEFLMSSILGGFNRIFIKCLKFKNLILGFIVALFVLSLIILTKIGGEFTPRLMEGDIAIDFQNSPSSSLNSTIESSLKAQKALLKAFPEIKEIVGRIGASEVPTDPMPPEMADLMINLKDQEDWVSGLSIGQLTEKMAEVLEKEVPGSSAEFSQPIEMRFNEMIAGSKSEFAIKIFGDNMAELELKASEIEKILNKTEGTELVKVERTSPKEQINIKIDRDKLGQYGVNIDEVNFQIQSAFAGKQAGVIYEEQKNFDIIIKQQGVNNVELENIKNLKVKTLNGNYVNLDQIAAVQYLLSNTQISREKGKRRVIIGVDLKDVDIETYASNVKKSIESSIDLKPGYFIEYGGAFENLKNAKKRLYVAIPLALLLILVLLYFSLESFSTALLVFTAIPLSTIGGIFALWIRGMPFSISAGIGFIALFGVAVLNGLVLISYINQLNINDKVEKVKVAVNDRFRPVIITALVASLGFFPMAFSMSAGAEVQKPLATVVIGGLVSSTILTLIILPILYLIFNKKQSNSNV